MNASGFLSRLALVLVGLALLTSARIAAPATAGFCPTVEAPDQVRCVFHSQPRRIHVITPKQVCSQPYVQALRIRCF
jgi:hypothetical protein